VDDQLDDGIFVDRWPCDSFWSGSTHQRCCERSLLPRNLLEESGSQDDLWDLVFSVLLRHHSFNFHLLLPRTKLMWAQATMYSIRGARWQRLANAMDRSVLRRRRGTSLPLL